MDNFAFASARQLRTAMNDGVLTAVDALAVLQARKERKESQGLVLKGKSLGLMNSLLGVPAPAKAAKAAEEPRAAVVGEAEAYAAKLKLKSAKQLAQQASRAFLPWKKSALAAEIASRDAAPATPEQINSLMAASEAQVHATGSVAQLEAMLAKVLAMQARVDAL